MKHHSMTMARLGTVFYLLWGLLHIYAAITVYQLGNEQVAGMVQGKLHQEAWNLAWLSLFVIMVAVRYNWRNDRLGYWLNLIVVSLTDLGFVLFVFIPGYSTDLLGPILWLLGAVFTTVAAITAAPTIGKSAPNYQA